MDRLCKFLFIAGTGVLPFARVFCTCANHRLQPSVSVWSPIVASACFGLGTICVFISSYMYVIDSYDIYAASALGFMTVSRYCAAGGMTIVGVPFYRNMGVHWTLTILGCISAIMVPVPYIFYRYGPVIRRWSRYAVAEEVKV